MSAQSTPSPNCTSRPRYRNRTLPPTFGNGGAGQPRDASTRVDARQRVTEVLHLDQAERPRPADDAHLTADHDLARVHEHDLAADRCPAEAREDPQAPSHPRDKPTGVPCPAPGVDRDVVIGVESAESPRGKQNERHGSLKQRGSGTERDLQLRSEPLDACCTPRRMRVGRHPASLRRRVRARSTGSPRAPAGRVELEAVGLRVRFPGAPIRSPAGHVGKPPFHVLRGTEDILPVVASVE